MADHESGRHIETDLCHLAQIGTLAAEGFLSWPSPSEKAYTHLCAPELAFTAMASFHV